MGRELQDYHEDNTEEFGVENVWKNTEILDSIKTERGTLLEFIKRPHWGLACYMNNSVQSCLTDEHIYHEALVHPVMSTLSNPKRVCIFGGGEGATAREVLKYRSVETVDMFEWDCNVVSTFREFYPQWAQGAWDDPRLTIHYSDIFTGITDAPEEKYDIIIMDLFEPSDIDSEKWIYLFKNLKNWLTSNGSIVMYAGMRAPPNKPQPYSELMRNYAMENILVPYDDDEFHIKSITPYRVYIPSFSGESCFLLFHNPNNPVKLDDSPVNYKITDAVWNSYRTFNW